MDNIDALNLATFGIRLVLGLMILAHGWRHLQSLRSGPGMANWFESLGVKPGSVHAQLVTYSELGVGVALLVGLLTPLAYGGLASILIIAGVTNHRKNGFFINAKQEGWEYVGVTAALSIFLATFGPGEWSLDDSFDISFPFEPKQALLVAAILGIGGSIAFLAAFWRPPAPAPDASGG